MDGQAVGIEGFLGDAIFLFHGKECDGVLFIGADNGDIGLIFEPVAEGFEGGLVEVGGALAMDIGGVFGFRCSKPGFSGDEGCGLGVDGFKGFGHG